MQDILTTLLLPHFRSIAGLSVSQLLYGFLQAAQNQVHSVGILLPVEAYSVPWRTRRSRLQDYPRNCSLQSNGRWLLRPKGHNEIQLFLS